MPYATPLKGNTLDEAKAKADKAASWEGTRVGLLYRVEAHSYAYRPDPWDDSDDNWATTSPQLELTAYAVQKWTKCGATLFLETGFNGRGKFINLTATKRFACRTVEEAIESFRQRRLSQIRRLRGQLAKAKRELALVEKAQDGDHALLGQGSTILEEI